MKNEQQARLLAKQMIQIGKLANKETICVLSDMNEPLGNSIGNILEVKEAVSILKGEVVRDVEEVVLELGAYMLKLVGKGENIDNNKRLLKENIKNGKAYKKFLELVENQGGDISYLENLEKFEKAKIIEPVYSNKSGYIYDIDAKKVGELACDLGAGRILKDDVIEPKVGIVLNKKVGYRVEKGEVLGYIHSNDERKAIYGNDKLIEIIKIQNEPINVRSKILEIVS